MADHAVIGGATAYAKDPATGNHEVDAKFNDIWRAQIRAANRNEVIPNKLLAAMVMVTPEVYAWVDQKGGARVSVEKPGDVPEDDLLVSDGPKTVAVVTGRQLIRLGLVSPLTGDDGQRPWMPKDERWVEVQPDGQSHMRIARRLAWREHEKELAAMRGFEYSWKAAWDPIELLPAEYIEYEYEDGQTVTAVLDSVTDNDYMRALIIIKHKGKRNRRFKFDVILGREAGWAQQKFVAYGSATVETPELQPGEQRSFEVIVPVTNRAAVNQCKLMNVGPLN